MSFLRCMKPELNTHATTTRIKESVESYIQKLTAIDSAKWNAKPANEGWSFAQMYDHLISAHYGMFARMIKGCASQAYGQEGGEMNGDGEKIFAYNSLPPIDIKVPQGFNAKQPEVIEQTVAKDQLEKILRELDALRVLVEGATKTYKIKHPIIGPLNAQQWYNMCDMHWRHHFRQLRKLEKEFLD
ncbi:DinB family protein [Cytophagales bacterium SYC-11]